MKSGARVEGKSDALIVGAGPTGCAAGIVLARAGIDVCVVDRAHFPRDKVCGDAISNDGIELLEQLGARDAVDQGPHAVVERAVAVFPDGTRVGREYERPGYIVARYHLDDCLRRTLEAWGAKLVQDRRVSSLTRTGDRVTGGEGPGFSWSAKVVIAADGYGSVGLQALGQPGPRGRYRFGDGVLQARRFPERREHGRSLFRLRAALRLRLGLPSRRRRGERRRLSTRGCLRQGGQAAEAAARGVSRALPVAAARRGAGWKGAGMVAAAGAATDAD